MTTTNSIVVLFGIASDIVNSNALSIVVVVFEAIDVKLNVPFVIVTYSESVVSVAVPAEACVLPTFLSWMSKPASSPKLSCVAALLSSYSLMMMYGPLAGITSISAS